MDVALPSSLWSEGTTLLKVEDKGRDNLVPTNFLAHPFDGAAAHDSTVWEVNHRKIRKRQL